MAKKEKKIRERAFDDSWKLVLEKYFWECLDFYFPEESKQIDKEKGYLFLDQELRHISPKSDSKKRRVDKLAKVYLLNSTEVWILLHIEVQTYQEEEFAKRMYAYHYRIWDKYQKPVASLAILADKHAKFCPQDFSLKTLGKSFVEFHFIISKILDWKGKEKDLEQNPGIFAIVTLASLKAYEENLNTRAEWKFLPTKMLYERGYGKQDILALYSFLDGIMVLPEPMEIQYNDKIILLEEEEKMAYITTAERIGIQKGLEKGLEKGVQKGLQKGLQKGKIEGKIEMMLEIKFDKQGQELMKKIHKISDLKQLNTILQKIKEARDISEIQSFLKKLK